jgi:HEAT repeat protein
LVTLTGDGDGEVRRTAIPLLGLSGVAAAINRLLEIIGDVKGRWDTEEKLLACRAVAKSGDRRAVPVLEKILKAGRGREVEKLRSSAVFALSEIGGEQAERILREQAVRGGGLARRLKKFLRGKL